MSVAALPTLGLSGRCFFFIFTYFWGFLFFFNKKTVIVIAHCILDYSCDDDEDLLTAMSKNM